MAAAKSRLKIPFWAMAALSLMPIWLFMYVRSVTEPPEVAEGPLGVGAEIYSTCQSCHGANGEGGVGRPFADGEVLATFPHIEDQLRFVYFGTAEYNIADVAIYGNPEREGEVHETGSLGPMPAQGANAGGALTDDEILAVVCHERYTLGGADPASEEYAEEFEDWCSDEAPAYLTLETGVTLAELSEQGLVNADRGRAGHHAHRRRPDPRIATRRVTATIESTSAGSSPSEVTTEVLVVGGGPAGAAAAYWLARHGHDVTVVEKKRFPARRRAVTG